MHKYKAAARRHAWLSENESTNYNPFAKRATRPIRQPTWDIEDCESTYSAPVARQNSGSSSLSYPISSSQDETDLRSDFTESNSSANNEPASFPDVCGAPVSDGQPAPVVASHKPRLKSKFGPRSKNKAS